MKYNNKQIKFYKEDVLKYDFSKLKKKFDLILSDIAPNTIGHKSTDHLRLAGIVEEIFEIVKNNICLKGSFVFKIWQGSENKFIINNLKKNFSRITNFKPKSSRDQSREIYIVAENFNV